MERFCWMIRCASMVGVQALFWGCFGIGATALAQVSSTGESGVLAAAADGESAEAYAEATMPEAEIEASLAPLPNATLNDSALISRSPAPLSPGRFGRQAASPLVDVSSVSALPAIDPRVPDPLATDPLAIDPPANVSANAPFRFTPALVLPAATDPMAPLVQPAARPLAPPIADLLGVDAPLADSPAVDIPVANADAIHNIR